MRTKILITSLAATLLMFNSAANATPSLALNGNNDIIGFNNISINGELWDATFSNTFTGTLYGEQFAQDASEALLTQFSTNGAFHDTWIDDHHEFSVVGFETPIATNYNEFFTGAIPYGNGFVRGTALRNGFRDYSSTPYIDHDSLVEVFILADNGVNYFSRTFVDWQQVSAVPEPATAFMFAPALLLCLGLRRRPKQA